MAETAPSLSTQSGSSRPPQPGDGAYLSTLRPGDGHYRAHAGSGPRGSARRGRGGMRDGQPRGPGNGRDGHRLDRAENKRAHGPAVPVSTSAVPGRSDGTPRAALGPPAELRPVVQPKSEAAQRTERTVRQDAAAAGSLGGSAGPNEILSERNGSGGGRNPRNRQGRGGAERISGAPKDRPAHLDAAAPAFIPPSDSLARLHLAEPAHVNGNGPGTATSSRASSVDGHGAASRGNGRNKRRENGVGSSRGKDRTAKDSTKTAVPTPTPATPSAPKSSRRAAFEQQTKLTTPGGDDLSDLSPRAAKMKAEEVAKQSNGNVNGQPDNQVKRQEQEKGQRKKKEEKDDLVSRLTRGLGRRPYLECPICFNTITPPQPIFSCLPPAAPPESDDPDVATETNHYQACYTPFHLSCVRDWADRSLAEENEKIRTNSLVDNEGKAKRAEWRCPGCQKRRVERVGVYKCFCGRLAAPSTNNSAPHSCAEPCSRSRPLCSHPCSLLCHPGPCPPCQVALIVPCPSHHTSLTVKCAAATSTNRLGTASGGGVAPVCDEVCERARGCGNREHTCQLLCHFGPCAPCTEKEQVRCYCGAESREETCGWGILQEKQCARAPEDGVEEHWRGRYGCGKVCGEKFDCGVHACEETCHPHPISPLPCPTSPSQILYCQCGQSPLASLPGPARTRCTDPIPTCSLPCPRSRPCGHPCPLSCHGGACPPCKEEVVRPCRCGESVFTVGCEVLAERMERGEGEMQCERVCKALRNCGRHECSRICCPLSYKAKSSRQRKKGANDPADVALLPGEEDLHTCQLTCGKLLGCGLHTCQRKDHRGACGRCLQASYDELICHCGETVVYPPVACGTTINCLYPCARPPPACGHPKSPHNCHESPSCPPCPYLTTRPCACGKDPAVKNVRCSQSIVSCGQACGELLSCGYHRCDKSCHRPSPAECGDCAQVCGKPKRVCRHPCTSACHAPAKCPEADPCGAIVDQRCACGNLSNRTTCGASTAKPESREVAVLKCNSECLVKQRNARLAEALGIKGADGRGEVEWSAELKGFAAGNAPFVRTVEGAFGEFIKSGKTTQILPHMPAAKRTFVTSLAQLYRLTTELIDAEPNRSVLIRRKIDTRLPHPLLSSQVAPPTLGNERTAEKKLGGLGNLRAPTPSVPASTAPGWGKSLTPAAAWGTASVSALNTPSASRPASGTATPAFAASRPTTPAVIGGGGNVAAVGHSTMSVPVNQIHPAVTGTGGRVVGQVGKVEEDDWDVDG